MERPASNTHAFSWAPALDAVALLQKKSCIQQRVPIRLTACHLGGVRPWFVCPVYCDGRYCGRRAAILYSAGELFACRRCYGLSYASQQEMASICGRHD